MSVSVRFMGQIGNQLFQYCLGHILAEQTGQCYRPPRVWLNKQGRPVKWTDEPLFPLKEHPGKPAIGPSQQFSVMHWIDFAAVDANKPVAFTHGYYQRYELFRAYKNDIRNDWLNLDAPFVPTDQDAVYIHVRRTDYTDGNPSIQGLSTTIDEFSECLGHFPDAKRMVIVTDDPNDQFHQQFGKLGLPWTISGLEWDRDFMLLASCRWMVMSQSTYSWWAGFLGRAERIVCPMSEGTFWRHGLGLYGPAAPDYPNLYVDDEPERWIWAT